MSGKRSEIRNILKIKRKGCLIVENRLWDYLIEFKNFTTVGWMINRVPKQSAF